MARCPNCTRRVHIWSNHTGFCSKRCREESRSACLNCGKVGLYKHERLGCCSDECRFWYVTSLLGYDREYILTPAWDKVVYHVRLPSGNAEISSLQLEELEFERAHETILVLAAPAWISRQKVLAELPYHRFDNPGWQHLRIDGTLLPEEVERFRRMCYDDPLLYHKLGVHVFEKIRGHGGTSPITPSATTQLAPGGVPLMPAQVVSGLYGQAAAPLAMLPQQAVDMSPPPLQIPQVSTTSRSTATPQEFAAQVCALFVQRGYQVSTANGESVNTLMLTKSGKQAIATYLWQEGMVGPESVQQFLQMLTAWEVSHGYFVTNGAYTLQVEDLVAGRPVQLIDGQEFARLLKHDPAAQNGYSGHDASAGNGVGTSSLRAATTGLNGDGSHTDPPAAPATVSLQARTTVLDAEPAEEAAQAVALVPEEHHAAPDPDPAPSDEERVQE